MTSTTNKTLELPANNADIDTWDVPNNSNFTRIDTAFGGSTALNATAVTGNVSLTGNQTLPTNIIISGVLSGNIAYQVGAGVGGFWSVTNNTTSTGNITFGNAGNGTLVTLLQGYSTAVKSDGNNTVPFITAPTNPGGSTTQVQYNSGGVFAGSSNFTFDGSTVGLKGVLQLNGSSSGYVGFQAPATTSSPVIWTLPAGDGTNGQVWATNGAGVLSWATVSGAGGVSSFNGRMNAVTLTSSDVNTALGYTAGNATTITNVSTSVTNVSSSLGNVSSSLVNVSSSLSSTNSTNVTQSTSLSQISSSLSTNIATTTNVSTSLSPFSSGTNANSIGYLGAPQTAKSGNYTAALADNATELFWAANGNGTIPANASVAFQNGSILIFTWDSGKTGNVTINSDTLRYPSGNLTGTRLVTGPGSLIARKEKTTEWWIVGGFGIS